MRRTVRIAAAVAAAVVVTVFAISCGDSTGAGPPLYTAVLTGLNEPPFPVGNGSTATGTATFTDNTTSVDFVLSISSMTAVTASHIHVGPPGCACPVITNLFIPSRPSGALSGVIATSTISEAANSPVSLDSLRVLFNNGKAYVNVHTTAFPGGEIRGVVTRSN